MLLMAMYVVPLMNELPDANLISRRSLFLAAEKNRSTFIAPIGIGLSLFICEMMGGKCASSSCDRGPKLMIRFLVAVAFTGGAVNPARAFGPAVVTGSFVSYH
jgi:aquaporin related protein